MLIIQHIFIIEVKSDIKYLTKWQSAARSYYLATAQNADKHHTDAICALRY